jgi:hypothetical protein
LNKKSNLQEIFTRNGLDKSRGGMPKSLLRVEPLQVLDIECPSELSGIHIQFQPFRNERDARRSSVTLRSVEHRASLAEGHREERDPPNGQEHRDTLIDLLTIRRVTRDANRRGNRGNNRRRPGAASFRHRRIGAATGRPPSGAAMRERGAATGARAPGRGGERETMTVVEKV